MCKIVNFNFNDLAVRTAIKNEDVLFCLVDVAKCLNISNQNNIIQRLDEAGIHQMDISYDSGVKKLNFINEPNLYRVIFRSDKPEAKSFQNWVFEEVLPQLRKTGKYEIANDGKNQNTQYKQKNCLYEAKINQINLNDFDNWQYFYMNDILLSFPYFRYKINKDTGFPLINIDDYVKCVGFKSYSLYLLEKDLKNNKEVMEFNKLYEITTDKFKLFKDYLEQFRQAFKKTRELKILQDLNNCQVIEEYEEKPAIADYMNYIGTEKLYTATEIGSILGISGCMVGKIANRLNLKIEKFGAWFKDKSSHSIKEVQTFKYNKNIIEELRKYLNTETKLIMA